MAIEIFLASVSAIAGLTQAMIAQGDRLDKLRALEAAQKNFLDPRWSVEHNPQLLLLAASIPEPIMEAMKDNVYRCWTRLEHFISGDQYAPDERTRRHIEARKCVCRELQEMMNYIPLESLPEDLQNSWRVCGCPTPS